VLAGVTLAEPDTGSVVELTLGSMVTEVALVVVHVSVAVPLLATVVGFTVRLAVGAAAGDEGSDGGGVCELVLPHAARVSANNDAIRTPRTLPRWRSPYIG
jgi:hypothetical protein